MTLRTVPSVPRGPANLARGRSTSLARGGLPALAPRRSMPLAALLAAAALASACATARAPATAAPSEREAFRGSEAFRAAVALAQRDQWRPALEAFTAIAGGDGPEALEAGFRVAECQHQLDDLPAARATLAAIVDRAGLTAPQRVRALARLGVVELERGRREESEDALRRALATWLAIDADTRARLDPYDAAQAEFYLGELSRDAFLAVELDPAGGAAQLDAALARKADLLLEAQGHYLGAGRRGDDRWAVSAGCRVGDLYDTFRRQLLEAPLPPGLDGPQQQDYRAELRERVRTLAGKAIAAYRAAIAGAEARGLGTDDVRLLAPARESLRRLEAEEPAAAASDGS